jgi:hypothetical protein
VNPSKANDLTLAAADVIVERAEERYQDHRRKIFVTTDRTFAGLMVGQWVFGVILALAVSPYAWEGKIKTVNMHVWAALVLGGVLTALPVMLALFRPGSPLTRHVIAAAQILWSALLIHLSGGRIETHFHIFGSLAFISFYRDWKVLLTAAVVVTTDHLLRGIFWPESIYGIVNPEWWRFLEHAGWVVFCVSFLLLSCVRGTRDMRVMAEKSAEIEALAENQWRNSSVLDRTKSAANA